MQGNLERRKHSRIPVDYEYFAMIGGRNCHGKCFDVSPYGVGILSSAQLNQDNLISMRIYIPVQQLNLEVKGVVKHCTNKFIDPANPNDYLVGIKLTEGTLDDFTETNAKKEVLRVTPSHTITIDAHSSKCYALLAAYERYPEWATGVEKAKVLEYYPNGRGKKVEFLHDFFFRKIKYILDYSYDDKNCVLSWVSAGGDKEIMKITGNYTFKPKGDKQCYATYELDIALSIIPNNRLVQYVTTIVMRKEMKNFKNFVEKNATTFYN